MQSEFSLHYCDTLLDSKNGRQFTLPFNSFDQVFIAKMQTDLFRKCTNKKYDDTILHCKAVLGWGQPGRMRWILLWIMPMTQDLKATNTAQYVIPVQVCKSIWGPNMKCQPQQITLSMDFYLRRDLFLLIISILLTQQQTSKQKFKHTITRHSPGSARWSTVTWISWVYCPIHFAISGSKCVFWLLHVLDDNFQIQWKQFQLWISIHHLRKTKWYYIDTILILKKSNSKKSLCLTSVYYLKKVLCFSSILYLKKSL